jgi:hypothetical protein
MYKIIGNGGRTKRVRNREGRTCPLIRVRKKGCEEERHAFVSNRCSKQGTEGLPWDKIPSVSFFEQQGGRKWMMGSRWAQRVLCPNFG